MKFTFEGYPELPNRAAYEQARQYVMQVASENKDVISLYEYGTVLAPGLSDLDFIVVINDELRREDLSKLIFLNQIPDYVARTINNSVPKPMNEMQFKRIRLLGDIQVKRLYGKSIPFDPINTTQQYLVKIADVLDWLPERTLMLGEYASKNLLFVKQVVGCLYSFQHTVKRIFDIIGDRDELAAAFVENLHHLRQDWHSHDKATNLTKLIKLLYEGIEIGIELMRVAANYLIDHNYYTPTLSQSDSYFYINSGKGFQFASISKLAGIKSNTNGALVLNVPQIWMTHLRQYSLTSGIISDLIRNNIVDGGISSYGIIEPGLRDVLNARIELCNDMATFLRRKGLARGLYRFAHLKKAERIEWHSRNVEI